MGTLEQARLYQEYGRTAVQLVTGGNWVRQRDGMCLGPDDAVWDMLKEGCFADGRELTVAPQDHNFGMLFSGLLNGEPAVLRAISVSAIDSQESERLVSFLEVMGAVPGTTEGSEVLAFVRVDGDRAYMRHSGRQKFESYLLDPTTLRRIHLAPFCYDLAAGMLGGLELDPTQLMATDPQLEPILHLTQSLQQVLDTVWHQPVQRRPLRALIEGVY